MKLSGNDRTTIYLEFDAVLDSPSLLLVSQSEPAIENFVKLNEGLKELGIGFGVAEMMSEECGELSEAVQTATSDHIKQFFR